MRYKEIKQDIESPMEHSWGGLKELVGLYFSKPRPVEQDLFWLKVTQYKEIKAIPKILGLLGDQFPQIDREVDRRIYEGLAYELADEVKHYRLLADIMEGMTGERVIADKCPTSPEQSNLEELRKTLRDDLNLAPHLNVAHETVFASVMKNVTGGPLEKKVAGAYKHIYSDELKHYRMGWKELQASNLDSEQIERIKQANKRVARQYLVMRNELFGQPLSKERLQEIDAGKIQSYRPL
jgi:hypothetical protein